MSRERDVPEDEYLSYGVMQLLDRENVKVGGFLSREMACEQLKTLQTRIAVKTAELEALSTEERDLQQLRQQLIIHTLAQ